MKPAARPRDWRRIHHSPMFWIAVVLCLAAITIYVLSDGQRNGTQRGASEAVIHQKQTVKIKPRCHTRHAV